MAAVELRGFSWRHAGRSAWAVRDVDLRVEQGERVLLLGPSGAGKSTLLAGVAGLLPADTGEQTGEIIRYGHSSADRRPAILFQDPQSQLVMVRSGDDVAFGLENHGVATERIWPRVREVLDTVGFVHPLDRDTATLSGGEAQRLALAGALAPRPDLLLLDEPTANLDPAGARAVRHALGRVLADRRTTMILIEHRVSEVLPLIDRVVVLAPGGGVRVSGPPERVFARHGAELAAQGVWVPDHVPAARTAERRSTGAALLHASGLGHRHAGSDTPSLSEVDLTISAGEVLAVLGHNGSGKSTLALLLGGLLTPGSGRIIAEAELAGHRLAGRPPHRWRAADLTTRIGSVFQNPEHQFLTGRVRDELALGPRRTGRPESEVTATVTELLERLRLDHLAGANPYTLSGGEARRLSVATALATAPRLLILDEPTFGQDLRTWRETVALLGRLADDGRALTVVTHDTELVTTLADRSVTLEHGRLVPQSEPAGVAR